MKERVNHRDDRPLRFSQSKANNPMVMSTHGNTSNHRGLGTNTCHPGIEGALLHTSMGNASDRPHTQSALRLRAIRTNFKTAVIVT